MLLYVLVHVKKYANWHMWRGTQIVTDEEVYKLAHVEGGVYKLSHAKRYTNCHVEGYTNCHMWTGIQIVTCGRVYKLSRVTIYIPLKPVFIYRYIDIFNKLQFIYLYLLIYIYYISCTAHRSAMRELAL